MHRPLIQTDLLPGGPLARLGRSVLLLGDVDSTNSLLLANAARLADGTIAAAEHQWAGRGRFNRAWEAPRGASVLLSVLLHESADSPLRTRGAMLACVAAAEAIESATDCRPDIAWPNDVLIGGRKVAGVLAESTPLPSSPALGASGGGPAPDSRVALVLGVGINCLQQAGHFRSAATRRATSLEIESAHAVDRPRVAGALVARLDAWLVRLARGADAAEELHAAWSARCNDAQRDVTLGEDGRTYTGVVEAVDAQGDLLVRLSTGERRRFAAATTTRLA